MDKRSDHNRKDDIALSDVILAILIKSKCVTHASEIWTKRTAFNRTRTVSFC